IYAAWETGKGLRTLAREFALSVIEVERSLDRMLPVFDAQSQLRSFKRELKRLEDLSGEFYTIAKRDKCRDSAHLVARLNERICSMRGWSPVNIRIGVDPSAVEAEKRPPRHERIAEAIMRLTSGPDGQPPINGNGNGAVPSDAPDPEAT